MFMKEILIYLTSFSVFITTVTAEPQFVRISLLGNSSKITLTETNPTAIFWALSQGNQSIPLRITVNGGENLNIGAKAQRFSGNTKKALIKKTGWYKLKLRNKTQHINQLKSCGEINIEEEEMDSESINLSDYPSKEHAICDLISDAQLLEIAEELSLIYGGNWGVGNACSYLVSLYEGGDLVKDPTEEDLLDWVFRKKIISLNYYGVLHKNNCLDKSDSKYLVKFEVSVPKKAFKAQKNIDVILSVTGSEYGGVRSSSIKPISEGRHAPNPLIMMNWLGNNCGNEIKVTTWNNTRILKVSEVPVYSHLYYGNLVLALGEISKVLTGGEGTFEIYNGVHSYGVCFQLERKRQKAFGYP